MGTIYTSLIMDMVQSRKLSPEQRMTFQKNLKQYLDRLNAIYEPYLKYPVVFSAGDSMQGLFYHAQDAYLYFLLLEAIIYPLEIRCGIGMGELTVDLAGFDSNMQDGPVYYRSREAIDFAKEKGLTLVIQTLQSDDLYLNELIYTMKRLEKDLTKKRRQIALLIDMLFPIDERLQEHPLYRLLLNDLLTNHPFITPIIKQMPDLKKPLIIDRSEPKSFPRFFDRQELKGVPTLIGTITDTSRQNIQQMIKQGKLTEIRHLKRLVKKFLMEYYDHHH